MSLNNDVMDMKREVKELREQSFAYELLKDYKKQSKRHFIIIIVLLIMLFSTNAYWIYNNSSNENTITTTENYDQNIDNVDSSVINQIIGK